MRITLTFDNGPTPETTPMVLDVLRRREARAVFFVLGKNLETPANRDLAVRARDEGHLIGNHTYSHSTQFGDLVTPEEAIDEITRTQGLIDDLAGEERLFRPYGRGGTLGRKLLNPAAIGHLETNVYTMALWTSVPRDWEDPEGWATRALADSATSPWSVIVLHDLPTGAMARLDGFLGALSDQGAELRQDFPLETTPILRGRRLADLDWLTERGGAGQRK